VRADVAFAESGTPTLTAKEIVELRAAAAPFMPSIEALSRGGAVTVRELTLPGTRTCRFCWPGP
jgi:hypothetical protein